MRHALPAAAGLAVALLILPVPGRMAGAEEKSPAPEREVKSRPSAWITDASNERTKISGIRIWEEHLGFLNFSNIPIEALSFKLGKADLMVTLNSLKTIQFRNEDKSRKAVMTSFFGETIEALVDTEVKVTLTGAFEFSDYEIDLSSVAAVEFDAPSIPIMYCEGCKKLSAESGFSFCPFDGSRLRYYSTKKLGAESPKDESDAAAKSFAAGVESGIKAHVDDDRGRKIEIDDAQLYREKLGLLSISQEPVEALKLKIGNGSVAVELRKVKNLKFEPGFTTVTDFEDRTFRAANDDREKFFIKGRFRFATVFIPFSDVRSVTFMPPAGNLKRCEFCHRLYSQKEWTHCPYDGTQLK